MRGSATILLGRSINPGHGRLEHLHLVLMPLVLFNQYRTARHYRSHTGFPAWSCSVALPSRRSQLVSRRRLALILSKPASLAMTMLLRSLSHQWTTLTAPSKSESIQHTEESNIDTISLPSTPQNAPGESTFTETIWVAGSQELFIIYSLAVTSLMVALDASIVVTTLTVILFISSSAKTR